MSYFDSRVDDCPVWKVVSIIVVRVKIKVDMTVFVAGAKCDNLVLRIELISAILRNFHLGH